ncbi:MAG: hypothetical protein NTW96_22000, partial [Planctomycetia bacterium]|nr:hypothetical protein [Planctomycetia bacterium]
FKVDLAKSDDGYTFRYRGDDGELVYRYRPLTGTLGDVTAEWGGTTFQPLAGGGVTFALPNGECVPPESAKLVRCEQVGPTVESTWQCTWAKDKSAEVTYTLRLWQKSLVIDVKCLGGDVGEFRVGRMVGLDRPRLVTLPYLVGDQQRPAVAVSGPAERPLFAMSLVDHTRSNASSLWMVNHVDKDGVATNGGSRYQPKTDGRRNDCFERLFLTVSPRFEEVLPNIPNPKSPWMHVAGERLWIAHGASNRDADYATWKEIARYGMTKVAITDHEVGWRDGGESFTFRTRAAPGKGGDESQADYARKLIALGFRYGIYNNYTDFAPVNEFWSEDLVTRLPSGEWQTAWARCYNPKPARAVEFEARLAPVIQSKFHLNTAYCDVHTAVRPWSYVDFDARVPGAGTFAATFYAYGEIMLHQKATWEGPVYSEGNNHWYYCGLTDGNYGQDQAANLPENPWLVDFDLLKMHPLCCNFGMGAPSMFFTKTQRLGDTPEKREANLDRFLAATLAFGHTGFLVLEGGMPSGVRSYFSVQQVHARYTEQTAADIRYADTDGKLLDTSAAVAGGAYRRSQIVTTYSDGLKVIVNGHPTETWTVVETVLPPNGWVVVDTREKKLIARSAMVDGHRADYVDSPAYLYADGRGTFTRFEKAACDGQMIAHKRADGSFEVIPVECTSFGLSLDGHTGTAVALDKDGGTLGPAETRLSRGLVYVTPVEKAFSYLVKPGPVPAVTLKCDREVVVPGETVSIEGSTTQPFLVPGDATPGKRLWHQIDGAWIDFTVRPMVDASLRLDKTLRLKLVSHLAKETDAAITLGDETLAAKLPPEKAVELEFPWRRPDGEVVREVPLAVVAGPLRFEKRWWLKTENAVVTVAALEEAAQSGQCRRREAELPFDGRSGAFVDWRETSCGQVSRHCLYMHPPYVTGPGYTFAVFPEIALPSDDKMLFRAEKPWGQHAWTPLEVDLSPWAGKPVRIKLVADVGPADNANGDWAAWAEPRVETAEPVPVTTIHEQPVALRYEPGPSPLEKPSAADLRRAQKAVLRFQAIGLEGGGEYISRAQLNKVPLGNMPATGGDERKGVWGDGAIDLSPEAVATLDPWNDFTITNPGSDCFKIRRVWLELMWPDGRKGTSAVTTTVYTQPPGWPYAEGETVPAGEDIKLRIRF